MPQRMPPAAIDPKESHSSEGRSAPLVYPSSYAELMNLVWPRIGWGVIFAGGTYPILLGAGLVLVQAVALLRSGTLDDWLAAVFFCAVGAPTAAAAVGIAGMAWAGLVTVLALPLAILFCWTLNLRPKLVRLGATFGGLVGFLAVTPVVNELPQLFQLGESWRAVLMIVCGPGVTVPLGQLGGALGARSGSSQAYGHAARHRALVEIGWRADTAHSPAGERCESASSDGRYFQFGTRQLLWVAVWLGVLLTVIRIFGIPYEWFLALLVGWLAYQTLTQWAGWRIGRAL